MTDSNVEKTFGVVVIGRNEGERLVRCLESLAGEPVVYVDSGSTDGSVERSREMGADVVELDMSLAFTAARARNAGAGRLLRNYPQLKYIQFVDGDCQLSAEWIPLAVATLEKNPHLAVVCGRRREVNRESSKYNMFCDIEWDTPVGDANACGGDAMYRVEAYRAVGQFDESFIAGEEPELCYRLRRAGWGVRRLNSEMTMHDASMYHLRQWWKRSERSGFAYALGAWEHGTACRERYNVKESLRVVFWALVIPLVSLALMAVNLWLGLAFLATAFFYHGTKIYLSVRKRHDEFRERELMLYSAFLVLQKFPELLGVARCSWQRLRGQSMKIIEYK